MNKPIPRGRNGGRKKKPDKKKTINIYARPSEIEAHGGEDSLKEKIYNLIKISKNG